MVFVVLLSMSIHACYIGSKVVVSLFALELGASQAMVGVLAACYAAIPLVLGVYTGRLADTHGMRMPLMIGAVTTAVAMFTGFVWRDLAGLFAVSLLMGGGFVFFNVSIQTLVGGMGRPEHRPRNFAWLSIGYSMSSLIGPVFAGFSIDHAGHPLTFLFFSFVPLIPIALLAFRPALARVELSPASAKKGSPMELLRDPPLRRLIIISGLSVASSELFAFYVPVFTHQIGMSATTTGLILGSYAVAILVTRFMLGTLTRRLRPDQIMFSFLLVAACAFAVFPFFRSAYALMATAFMIGIGVGCTQPLLMSTAYEKSPPGRTGEVTGLRLTAN
ncbi:MAG TPA: MFS transporter, partial [Burkholderiales bacterium]|nr:MFS transporter [Burkholderiales bacterium]